MWKNRNNSITFVDAFFMLAGVTIVLMILVAIASLPFAALGWIVGVSFGISNLDYHTCAAIGILIAVLLSFAYLPWKWSKEQPWNWREEDDE